MDLKLLDLFSGIGGFSYAAEKIVGGYKTTQFVEIDPYCQSVLRKNFPNTPIHDDIKTFSAKQGQFDVFTIGFPCQDLSVAGRQRGINDETRSGLFYESIRLLRTVRPRFALFENVRNLLSHGKGETFQEVLFQIAKAGYDAEWSVISAKDLGACHLRERIWILAYTNNYGSPSAERIRVNGKTNSSTQKGQDKISESQRSSESSDSRIIQQTADSSNPNSTRTESNSEKLEPPIWKHAFLNSKERRTLSPDWSRYVSEPSLCRGDDGLRGRVARIKAMGNSIVPQCAAVPLQRIKDLIKEKC
jgi:DNA (cytosine-5)-methyltransferase 1